MDKKFIEEQFPINEISELGRNEKLNRFDNISGIHVWWARRPTSVCRALILACLFDYPEKKSKRKEISKYIVRACSDFKNLPSQLSFKEVLKKIVINNSGNPKILIDPFSGGSAIPLEGARLGLKSYGIDLNPVAVLIGKATCEFFQKYNGTLINEIKRWWKFLQKKLEKVFKEYYMNPISSREILSFIWVRQVKCKNSDCNAIIPILSTLKLTNKKEKKVVLKPIIKRSENINEIHFIIQKNDQIDFDPNEHKIFSNGHITCPACGITYTNEESMKAVKKKEFNDKLLVIVEKDKNSVNRIYRIATEEDYELYQNACKKLKDFSTMIPNEEIPKEVRRWQVQNYGILQLKDFFNKRQLLYYLILSLEIKNLFKKLEKEYDSNNLIKAIMTYLSFILSRSVTHNSKFTHWRNRGEGIAQTWSRAGLFMKGNYPEQNPFVDFSGTPIRYLEFISKIVKNNLKFSKSAIIKQGDAINLDFDENSIDLIVTDPPYYDAMLYANPSDFFYIWLKKALEDVYPELFLFPLTPKEEEIIQSRFRHGGNKEIAIKFYEESLTKVLKGFHRVLKPEGLGVIMYTHKSVTAWEVLINAIIESNLTISAAWPIETETQGGIRTLNKVALASSIAIVFKKIEKDKKIFFETEFINILEDELKKKLNELLIDLEIYGADFFIASIGFSLNIFTRYKGVISQKTGQSISVSIFLDSVRKVVNDFLLSTILEKSVTRSIDDDTDLYIIWCWFFRNNDIPLDDALKLAQSFGIELDDLRKRKLIRLYNKNFKLLLATDKSRSNYLLKNTDSLKTLIDYLHLLAILWKSNSDKLEKYVEKAEAKFGENMWKVGQALAEFFPKKNKEHNILQGLLAKYGKSKPKSDIKHWALKT